MANILCTSAMCAQGKASVQEMRNTFDTLVANYSQFDRRYFESTVVSIERSFNDNYSAFSEIIPFNPTCCAIKDIGSQADQVTQSMNASVAGAQAGIGPGSQGPPIELPTMAIVIAIALGLIYFNKKIA